VAYRDIREIRSQMRLGMPVVGEGGRRLGTVKELLGEGFRVDRSLEPDITVPYDEVETVNETGVMLAVPSDDANPAIDPGAPMTRPPHAP
jgi:hypothetical protein